MRTLGFLALVVAAATGCESTIDPVRGISGGGGGGTGSTTASITIGGNFFSPVQDTVGAGGTVTWTWTGTNRQPGSLYVGSPGSDTPTTGTFRRTIGSTGPQTYLFCGCGQ